MVERLNSYNTFTMKKIPATQKKVKGRLSQKP